MTKLEQKLLELGYEEFALCWRKEITERVFMIIEKDYKQNWIMVTKRIKSQQDIDNLQQAFNQLQQDLEVLKQCQD